MFEAGSVGSGTSGASSAHLGCVPEHSIARLASQYGNTALRRIVSARRAAIETIRRIDQEQQLDAEFRSVPAIFWSEGEQPLSEHALALREIGLAVAEYGGANPLTMGPALRIEGQARFHPLKYVRGLARICASRGVQIYEQSRCGPPQENSENRGSAEFHCNSHTVRARQVVAATHSAYFGISQLDTRIAPNQSYILLAEVERELEDALYWDDAEPYHYLRRLSDTQPRLLLVGGADHKSGQAKDERDRFALLEAWIDRRLGLRAVRQR